MQPRTKRVAASLVALSLSAALLAACGKGDDNKASSSTPASSTSATPQDNGVETLSAQEIVQKALDASQSATAVRFSGVINDDIESLNVDATIREGSSTGKLTVTNRTPSEVGTQSAEFTRINQDLYVKANDSFWTGLNGPASARLFKDKFAKATVDNPDFDNLDFLTGVSALFNDALKVEGQLSKGQTTDLNGKKVIKIVDSGVKGGDEGGTIYISTVGDPLILRVTGEGGLPTREGTEVNFDYNPSTAINPPPADAVVDYAQNQTN